MASGSARPKKLTAEQAKKMTEADWKKILTPEEFRVTRQHGTEPPGTGKYEKTKTEGVYVCSNCGTELFVSKDKFDSGSGWPSFNAAIEAAEANGMARGILTREDTSDGMVRTEVHCKNCNAHLGHVFNDGPKPTGKRFCINSCSLKLEEGKIK